MSKKTESSAPLPPDLTWADLQSMTFPQATWIAQGLLPVGLTILVGKPKLGKSIIAQNLCLSAIQGKPALGKFFTDKTATLNLCLEDPLWQFQDRLSQMMNGDDPSVLVNAHIFNRWPRMPQGIELLDRWLNAHPQCRLVIIDTLVEFRARQHTESGIYERDHAEVSIIQRLAIDRSIAIILVTHERKAEGLDNLDRVSGSAGIPAAADNIWIFHRPDRTKNEATLIVSGRSLRDVQYKLVFNETLCRWQCEGALNEIDIHPNETKILEALRQRGTPMNATEIAKATAISRPSIYRHMPALLQFNLVHFHTASKRYSTVS